MEIIGGGGGAGGFLNIRNLIQDYECKVVWVGAIGAEIFTKLMIMVLYSSYY